MTASSGTITLPAPALRTTEKAWMRTVLEAAQVLGYRVYHTAYSIGSQAGYPDLTIVGRSPKGRPRCMFVELKTDRGKLTSAQEDWLVWLRESGQEVYVWRPNEWDAVLKVLQDEL